MEAACVKHGIRLFIPKAVYSTDNAAMIATLASLKLSRELVKPNNYDVAPFASFEYS
jgi:N6-L-threonylcarbamoyladenine synthase